MLSRSKNCKILALNSYFAFSFYPCLVKSGENLFICPPTCKPNPLLIFILFLCSPWPQIEFFKLLALFANCNGKTLFLLLQLLSFSRCIWLAPGSHGFEVGDTVRALLPSHLFLYLFPNPRALSSTLFLAQVKGSQSDRIEGGISPAAVSAAPQLGGRVWWGQRG